MEENATKVCLIDDSKGDYRLVQEILGNGSGGKFSISHFRNLAEGVKNLSEKQYDILLLDLFLPDSDGLSTFNSILDCEFEIPIVVLTGLEDEKLARLALQSGAQDYLVKGEFDGKLLSRSINYSIERFRLRKSLMRISITDDLTGLHNRRGFITLAEQQINSARRTGTNLLVLFIDVDGIKEINDRFGHQVGDRTLVATAEILRNTFRASDIIARIGGDEFAVMAVSSKEHNLKTIRLRLDQKRKQFLNNINEDYELLFSVGISEWQPECSKDLSILMNEADAAMYDRTADQNRKLEVHSFVDEYMHFEALDSDQEIDQSKDSIIKNLLLIEDNPADARLVQEFLKDCETGHCLEHVTLISDALQKISENTFDVILLDLSLPDSHGIQSLDTMLEIAPNIPIIVMTGTDDRELATLALKKGAQDYLTKGSYDEGLLERSIQYAIERHHLHMQNLQYSRELKLSESRFRRISDENVDGILILDSEQRVLFSNPAAELLFEQQFEKNLVGQIVDIPVGIRDPHQVKLFGDKRAPIHLEIRQAKIPWQGTSAFLTSVRDVTTLVMAQEAISRQAEDLGLINTINDALNHGVDLEEVVKILQEGTKRVLSAHKATIYLMDSERKYLSPVNLDHLETIFRDVESYIGVSIPGIQIPILPGSLTLEFLESEDPVLVDDNDDIKRWMLDFIQLSDFSEDIITQIQDSFPDIQEIVGVEAMIIAPLVADGEVFGLLEISTTDSFTRSDLWRVATIAKQISMAISRKISEERMRLQSAALDSAANAILITDRSGNISWSNPAFTNLTGYSPDDVVGKNPRILNSGNHDVSFYQQLWNTILNGHTWFGEMVNKRKTGELYHEEMTIAPLTNDTGEVSHFIAIKQDITSRKSAEKLLQRQLDELAILHSVAVVCVEEDGEDLLIEKVTDLCSGTLYPEHFGVLLLDEDENILRNHKSFRGLPEKFVNTKLTLNEGIVGSVASSGKSRRIADVNQTPEYIKATEGMNSALSVPVKVGDRVIGVIHTESKDLDAFSSDDERLLVTIAGQLATAIEKIRQQKAEREQRIRAEAISDTALTLNSSLEFNQILDQILDNILRIVPYETASLMLNDNGSSTIIRHIGFEERGFAEAIDGLVFDIDNNGNLKTMIETGEPLVLGDLSNDPAWSNVSYSSWIRSYLGVPIQKDGKTIGFLNLDHSQREFFTENHAKALNALANQLSTALENARLYEETELRAAELSRLYNASGVLLALTSTDMRQSGQAIVDTLRSEFGQTNCSLLLVGENNSHLERIAAAGLYSKIIFEGQPLLLDGPGIAPSAFRKRKIINVPDVSKREDYIPNWEDAMSELAVPLIVGEQVIGVIDIQSAQKNAFGENDERLVSVFAERAALFIENTRLYQRQERQLAFLESLHQIDLAITSSMNLNVTLDVIARQVMSQLQVDALSFLVLDIHTLTLDVVVQNGFLTPGKHRLGLRLGEGLGGEAAQKGQVVRMQFTDERRHDSVRLEIFKSEGFSSYYGIPLVSKGQVKGVLELFHRGDFEPDLQWKNFSETVATQAAIAIDNALLFQDLERSNMDLSLAYDTTLEGWAKALELRDHETEGHSRRVVEMAIELSQKLGINGTDLVNIRRGALLHDIGKMGVPDSILQKAGPLDDNEWEIMRKHPVFAYEWLQSTKYLKPALDIPHYHHEKWDGSGYPEGLKGEEIPIAARIFAIIDVWDALRSDRPYRKAWSLKKTIKFVQDQKGHHFDPQVVDAFLEIVQDVNFKL